MEATNWFAVDKDGLKEMFQNFPLERMVMELVQNAWDEKTKICDVTMIQDEAKGQTLVNVYDDNPEGFKNLTDAYTLFGHTDKRSDPTKRGRFNFGEKIVLARAIQAEIKTTTGTVIFNDVGRIETKDCTESGSVITVKFPICKQKDFDHAVSVLNKLYVPAGITCSINNVDMVYAEAYKKRMATLKTEFIKDVEGQGIMTKTNRKTAIWFYPKRSEEAYLLEMGLPVCPIDGAYDVDVQQKIPLSQDRTLVPQSFLQDIYAEMIMALGDEMAPDDLSSKHVRVAMEDDRVDCDTASRLFKQQFGDDAVIQTMDPDSNQEAARAGAAIVSNRTFGAVVNNKLREGGVQTTTEKYCRDRGVMEINDLMPMGFKEVQDAPHRDNISAYMRMLSTELCMAEVEVRFGNWPGPTAAIYNRGHCVTLNVHQVTKEMMDRPVSRCTALIIHELAHTHGVGHDGIYDQEFERLIDRHTKLLIEKPELYEPFEPSLFAKKKWKLHKPSEKSPDSQQTLSLDS